MHSLQSAGSGMFDPDGSQSGDIVRLWWLMVILGGAVFAVFAYMLLISLRGRGDARPDGLAARRWVVGGGVVMPSIVLAVVLAFTVYTMRRAPATVPADALHVEVVGHQWWWEIRYPDHHISTANELHLPVSRPVAIRLRSADVIHSLWIPSLAGKMDLLPDYENTLIFEADEPGRHRTQCAEFCGLQHAKMALLVVVEPEADFAAWAEANARDAVAPAEPTTLQGRQVFGDAGCASCHTVRGTEFVGTRGPDLTHIAGRETLAAATVPFTRDHARQWITDPDQIKRGTAMPATTLSEEALEALVAYLESLR
jgi:cytochrome c oxidase subunit 2